MLQCLLCQMPSITSSSKHNVLLHGYIGSESSRHGRYESINNLYLPFGAVGSFDRFGSGNMVLICCWVKIRIKFICFVLRRSKRMSENKFLRMPIPAKPKTLYTCTMVQLTLSTKRFMTHWRPPRCRSSRRSQLFDLRNRRNGNSPAKAANTTTTQGITTRARRALLMILDFFPDC